MKRIISALILGPLVILVFVFGNKYVVDVTLSIIAIRCIYELYHAFSNKGFHPIKPIGYIAAALISLIHVIPVNEYLLLGIGSTIIISFVICFLVSIITNNKYNPVDIAITYFGVFYIVLLMIFASFIREMENGKFYIWILFFASWMTDIFAYLVGSRIGKHKFTKISPNKSIEGCIGGTLGAVLSIMIYTYILNTYVGFTINYAAIGVIAIILSVIGQIGDLAASAIKRYTEIKDFSNLIPGHGGMIDRIDSVLFIAPFAYVLLLLFIV